MTVEPTSPSTVRAVPPASMNVILTMAEWSRRIATAGEEVNDDTPAAGAAVLSAHVASRQC